MQAWSTNMEEFELRATKIIQELHNRQEAALAAVVESTHAEAKARVKPSKAVLDLIKTQERLARSGTSLGFTLCLGLALSAQHRPLTGCMWLAWGQHRPLTGCMWLAWGQLCCPSRHEPGGAHLGALGAS